jgi:hypothetical protein
MEMKDVLCEDNEEISNFIQQNHRKYSSDKKNSQESWPSLNIPNEASNGESKITDSDKQDSSSATKN